MRKKKLENSKKGLAIVVASARMRVMKDEEKIAYLGTSWFLIGFIQGCLFWM